MKKLFIMAVACLMAVCSQAQVTFTCTAGQAFGTGEGCQKAFDGNTGTKWCKGPGNDAYALFTASQPVYVWGYEFTTANDNEQYGRLVRGWKLYATNDEAVASDAGSNAWVEISAWENELIQKKNYETFRFYVENQPQTAYKYFKLVITKSSDNLFQISKFELCYNTDANIKYNWVAGTNDGMKKLIDKKVGVKAEGNDMPDGAWITLETADGLPHTVKSYSMTTHDDGSWNNRAPKNWIVEGSINNSDWVTIDEVTTDPLQNKNYTTTQFTPSNQDGAYRYVRLTIRNYKGGYHQLAEFFVNAGCANAHSWALTDGKQPTCVEKGGGIYTCSACGGKKIDENVPATGIHSYTDHYCTVCQKPDPTFFAPVNGYYELSTVEQMAFLERLLNYAYEDLSNFKVKLMNDINLDGSGFAGFGNGSNAKEFKGEFDGQGHYLENLHIDVAEKNIGLFGKTNGANIHDLGLKKAEVKAEGSHANTSVVVGNAKNTVLNRVAVMDSYVEGHDHVGALVGNTEGSTVVSNCLSNAEISSRVYQAGGLIGTSNGLTLEKSLFNGNVTCYQSNASGLVSLLDSEDAPTTLRNNLSAATAVVGATSANSLMYKGGRSATYQNNYVLESTLFNNQHYGLTQPDDFNGCNIADADAKVKSFYATTLGWDMTNDWKFVHAGEFPVLAWMEATTSQEVSVSEAGYATVIATYDLDLNSTDGVSAYMAQKSGDYIHLEPITAAPAGNAIVVKAAAGNYALPYAGEYAAALTGNELLAATSDVTADGSQYVLAKKDGLVGFYQVRENTIVPAGKAYMLIAAGIKGFYGFEEEEGTPTAIEGTPSSAEHSTEAIYNLSGQRVAKMQKGINIIGGKKVIR